MLAFAVFALALVLVKTPSLTSGHGTSPPRFLSLVFLLFEIVDVCLLPGREDQLKCASRVSPVEGKRVEQKLWEQERLPDRGLAAFSTQSHVTLFC